MVVAGTDFTGTRVRRRTLIWTPPRGRGSGLPNGADILIFRSIAAFGFSRRHVASTVGGAGHQAIQIMPWGEVSAASGS